MLERFDIHTHVFHAKIAAKVVHQLESHYHVSPIGTGELDDLIPRLQRAGIRHACIHSAATAPEQVIPANRWAITLSKQPGIIPFGTMHPDYHDMNGELTYLYRHGIRGIKLHPDFQGFRLDDPKLLPLFDAMQDTFTLMVHIGDNLPPRDNPSCPWKIAAIRRAFPRLQIIAAHFGGFRHWPYVLDAMLGSNIYIDTSSSLFTIPQPWLEKIFHSYPHPYILFGSDYPLFDPAEEIRRLQFRLHLSDNQLEEILTNAHALGLR